MEHRRRPYPSTVRATVDRISWPLVVLMLAATVVTLGLATQQSRSTQNAYQALDRATVRSQARFVSSYLASRFKENTDFLTTNRDAFQLGQLPLLQDRIERVYLAYSPDYVRGVVITHVDGSVAYAAHSADDPSLFANPAVLPELSAVGSAAAGRGLPVASGRVNIGGRSMYAYASPLTGLSKAYGSWVAIYDVADSPLGQFFARDLKGLDAHPVILDDRGQVIAGPQRALAGSSGQGVHVAIKGTSWTIASRYTVIPNGIPLWIFITTVVGLLLLGSVWWLQESSRKALAGETHLQTLQVERLYTLAADLLHSSTLREQAGHLANSLHDALGVAAVQVHIAEERNREGSLAGEVPRSGVRQYRLAICGPRAAIGELVIYQRHNRIDDDQRRTARTMAAIAGAAMHTLLVLERERLTALELQRIDELRTNLLSTVAHELRSPLTAVKGVLGLLQMQDDLSDKAKQYVEVAEVRTDALVDLIRDLFDCSLLETGQLDIRPQRCEAAELLERSLGALAASQPENVVLSATPNLKVTVDPLRFDQIVNNLVTNAFRHGAPPIIVELRPYRDGAILVVSDNGPGVSAIERERIFSKFYQSDSGHARLVEGAGLGLALVQGLVRLHGGRIDVDSVRLDGSGGRFTVHFPDVMIELPPVEIANMGRRRDDRIVVPDVIDLAMGIPEGDAASG